jgi:catalase-peroxidase
VPTEGLVWQDPLPEVADTTWAEADIAAPKEQIAASELTDAQLISTEWSAASSSRGSDKRGSANGARIRLEPQRSWVVNVHMLAGLP